MPDNLEHFSTTEIQLKDSRIKADIIADISAHASADTATSYIADAATNVAINAVVQPTVADAATNPTLTLSQLSPHYSTTQKRSPKQNN